MEDVVRDGENRNKFWSYIKSKGQEFSGVAPLKNKAGFIQSDNLSKANILNDPDYDKHQHQYRGSI